MRIQLGTNSAASADSCLVYNYYQGEGQPASCTSTPTQASSGDNGTVAGYWYQDSVNTGLSHTASYSYDALDRLTAAAATGNATFTQSYTYGATGSWAEDYGNMSCVTGSGYCPQVTFDTSTNRVTAIGSLSASYDAAGDMTSDGTHTYQWDAEGRLISVDSGSTASYIYNALGERVRKDSGGTILDSVYDVQGRRVLYGNTQPSFVTWQDYLYAGGRLVALYADSATRFVHPNVVGSTSVLTDQTGAEMQDELYYPWGDRWQAQGTVEDERFASMRQRDTESDLYPTQFRNYSPGLGRWMSPDPAGLAAVSLANPQTWNMYAYVTNNPTSFMDPLGLQGCDNTDPCTEQVHGHYAPIVDPLDFNGPATLYSLGSPTVEYIGTGMTGGTGGGGAPAGQPASKGTFACASDFAEKYSIAGGLHALGIGKSGVGGFVTNALGGNVFSGATDLYLSLRSGEAGGHNVFFHMGQGVAAGPSLGFAPAFGKSLEGTPWASGPADVATGAILSGAQRLVTGAGQTIQTLTDNPAVLGSVLGDTAEWASGFGLLKLGYDASTYFGGAVGCAAGVIQ